MWELEVWSGSGGGSAGDKALALGPPALEHLFEDSAEPNQEAMAEVAAGVDLLSSLP